MSISYGNTKKEKIGSDVAAVVMVINFNGRKRFLSLSYLPM
jgi:hypothetical protein